MTNLTKIGLFCFAVLPIGAQAQDAATSSVTQQAAHYYTATGEAKTLPADVGRLRLPLRFYRGDKAYDGDGKKVTLPVDIAVSAGAIVLEYGFSDRLSLQLKTNFFLSQKVSAKSDSGVRSSDFYKDNVQPKLAAGKEDKLNGLAAFLAQTPNTGCTSVSACRQTLAAGFKLPTATTFPSGDVIPAGVPWQTAVEAGVQKADDAAVASIQEGAKRDGKSGVGDTDLGFLYAVMTKEEAPVAVSVGAGLRVPTGTSVVDANQIVTSRGTTDLGVRVNLDYPPVPGVMFSWQNQSEVMILKGKKNNTALVKSDVERVGLRNVGFLKGAWGLGTIVSDLAPLGLYASYNYDIDGNEKVDGIYANSKAPRLYSVTMGTVLDGLPLQLPLQLELEYEMAVAGRNQNALNTFGTTLKAYYKF